MRNLLSPLAALAILVSAFGPTARAVNITFDFTTGVDETTTFTQTVAGYTLTLSNPVGTKFNFAATGMIIGDTGYPPNWALSQFDIQVTGGPLVFLNYEVGFARSTSPAFPFDLNGGTGTSTGNSLASVGVFNFNGSKLIAPGDTVTFLSAGTTDMYDSTIKKFTFSTVPEPSTYALGAIATGVMAADGPPPQGAAGLIRNP